MTAPPPASGPVPPSGDPAPHPGRWAALAALWLVYFSFGMTTASLAPLLPEVREDLGATDAGLGLILGAWALAYIFAALPAGVLLDRLGPRAGLTLAAGVVALSAAMRGWSGSSGTLLLAVFVFGVGGPLISVGAPKLIAGLFRGPARGTAMGIYITGPSVGTIATLWLTHPVLLPLAGGWRGVMFLHAGIAVLAGAVWLAVATATALPRPAPDDRGFDGAALKGMLRDPAVLAVLSIGIGAFYVNHALINWLPELLTRAGLTPETAGLWASFPTLMGLCAALLIPRFAIPARRRWIMAVVAALGLAASLLLHMPPSPGLILGLLAFGVVRGSMVTLATLSLMDLPSVPSGRLGMAGGLFFSAAEIGGLCGPLVFGLLLSATGSFTAPVLSLTVVSVLLLAVILGRKRRA